MSFELLHQSLYANAEANPDAEALIVHKGASVDYGSVVASIETLARQFQAAGVGAGDRIAVYLPKTLLSALAPYAASLIGAVFVPVNPLLKAAQLGHILRDSEAKLLVTSAERAARHAALIASEPLAGRVLVDGELADPDGFAGRALTWAGITRARDRDAATVAVRARAGIAALLYTSGSTGNPKGVVVTHANLLAGIDSVAEYLRLSADDRLLAVLPFSFDYGLNQLTTALAVGGTCVMFEYLLARDILTALAQHDITGLAGVPTLWSQLAALEPADTSFPALRYFTNSGGALPRSVLARIRALFPAAEPFLMYGLTEAFRSTYLPPKYIDERPGSIGIPIPGADIVVINAAGKPAAADEEGELVHSGCHVTAGYWNNPAATAERFRAVPGVTDASGRPAIGVWSGDIVRTDSDGFLYFVGRRDGQIKTSGYRVSPEEIEEAAYTSGLVDMAGAFGIADETLGQVIGLAVVPRASASGFSSVQVLDACRAALPAYMVPKEIFVLDTMPLNQNGKVDRLALAHTYAPGYAAADGS